MSVHSLVEALRLGRKQIRATYLGIPALALAIVAVLAAPVRADDERAVAAAVEKLGGKVTKDGDKVVEVNLEKRRLTDDDLKVLKSLKHLRKLDLEETGITDAGLKHLTGLTTLEVLDLEETKVTDAGLEHLHGLKSLKMVSLDDTCVTADGVRKLKEAIPGLTVDC